MRGEPSSGANEYLVYEGDNIIARLDSTGGLLDTYLYDGVDHPLPGRRRAGEAREPEAAAGKDEQLLTRRQERRRVALLDHGRPGHVIKPGRHVGCQAWGQLDELRPASIGIGLRLRALATPK